MKRTDRIRERGTQIVELAIILPILMFLALAIADGGMVLRFHQVINNSAREGARLSAQVENRGAITAIKSAVVQYAANNGVTISATNVTVDQAQAISLPDGTVMDSSLVTVSYPYSFKYISKLPFFNIPATVNLSVSAQFRNLY
jgi:Flp pilus assembly protein TadG